MVRRNNQGTKFQGSDMTDVSSIAQALPCQRRMVVQWVTAGILLPGWASGAQAQVALSGAINHAGRFRALS